MKIITKRLILRQWCDEDLPTFKAMSADTEVMRFFPSTLTPEQSLELATRLRSDIDRQGWGGWAVALKDSDQFIGFTGLQHQKSRFSFSPCTEIAWRIARPYWRRGYAREAAAAALKYGFETLTLDEIVAFTVPANSASRGLMKSLGMRQQKGTFIHPEMKPDDPLAEHVLYRLNREDWAAFCASS